MPKLLDYGGLSYLWQQIDRIKQDKLTIDTELDATSHNPVENMAIKFGIDALKRDMEDQIDTSNTFFYVLYNQIMPYIGSGSVTNTYTSSCYCVKNGAVVTIYFDIEGNYGNTIFPITEVIPNNARPYVDVTNLIAQSVNGFNNISVDSSSGQILITSENGIFNVHCVITYIVVPASVDPSNPDIDPEVEARIYNVKARMIKIGDYYPTYNSSNNTMSGYALRGAALTTDVSGEQFSGYEGNYTVYLQNANVTSVGNEQFYWSKKFGDTVNNEGKGSLFTFNECFEIASVVDEAALIEHGCDAIKELVETGDTIQYFVTAFGKHAWIGGVNSPNKATIKDKAYGATAGAGDYNGRFYWTDCILAHVLRFVPASIEEGGTVEIPDKTRPIIIDGTTIGYVDKVVPLKLIDKAYSWGNFDYSGGSTWRGAKLYCEGMPTPSTEALDAKFSGHLVISDWNKASSTGNIYSNDTYYQRIDSKLKEVEESGGSSSSSVDIPEWLTSLPDYENAANAAMASKYSGVSFYNGRLDLAFKSERNQYYILCIQPYANVSSDPEQVIPFNPNDFQFECAFDGFTGISLQDRSEEGYDIDWDALGWIALRYNGTSWQIFTDDNDFIEDVACIYNDDIKESVWNTEGHVVKVTGGIKYDFSDFDWYYDSVDWDILPITGGGTTIITSISQSPVNRRPNSSWEKTSYKLDTYNNINHEFD